MNVPFGRLFNDVVVKTGRPELVEETKLAIREATQEVHMRDFFKRDSTEDLIEVATPAYLFQLDVQANLPRFRKIRYIKKFDLSTGLPKENEHDKINEVDPDRLFDRYDCIKTNVFYQAGNNINIRLSGVESALLVSWYTYPQTDPDSYQSWIADMLSMVIVNLAAARIQRDHGMVEEANAKMRMFEAMHWPMIQAQDVS